MKTIKVSPYEIEHLEQELAAIEFTRDPIIHFTFEHHEGLVSMDEVFARTIVEQAKKNFASGTNFVMVDIPQ